MKNKNAYSILICAVSTLVLFCTLGLATSTISIYLPYIISHGHLTSTQGSSILSLRSLSSLIVIAVVVDIFYRKVKLRWGIAIALLCDAAAFFTYGTAEYYWQYCFAAVLAGIGYGIGGIVPVSILINRWFKTNRSLAIGICTAGSGVATIIVPPIFVGLAENISLQAAFLGMMTMTIIVSVLCMLFVRDNPMDIGKQPFSSDKEENIKKVNYSETDLSRGSRWVVLLGVLLLGAASHSANQHVGVLYTSNGVSETVVSMLISISGIALTFGKMMCGYVDDRIGGRKTLLIFSGFFLAGLLLNCLAGGGYVWIDLIAVVILNMGMPLTTVGTTMIAHDMSTEKTYARMIKDCQSATMVGAVLFTTVPGMIKDMTGSYVPAYYLLFATALIASVILQYTYYKRGKNVKKSQI